MSLTIAPNSSIDDENQHLNHNPTTSTGRELTIMTPSRFKLPDEWLVQRRRRISNPDHVDKYYIEPHTGHKFRSLISVRRYLNGDTRDYLPTGRMISENKNTLPDDWLVQQRRRISNPNHIDKYYIEPHTGQKFRSLISVKRYLNEETRDYLPTERMILENKNTACIKSRTKQKFRPVRDFEEDSIGENACRDTPKDFKRTHYWKKIKTGEDDITRPPIKVRWVLSGPGIWNPFLNGSIVPASEKTKWSEEFSISINEEVTNGY
ncbi:unnamed protein product [Lathyrus oleraceus]|uniref:MBD domain-containing protein n=1 Tax=Pisum sativum TaxID=3888 RepID=A0A9D4X462_PEA|nr:methyl-CpG-binding domain-containing protein 7-like [Pisum sativum]KAI5413358.1 hypothetical protein KIW84_057815 [Pisum sativum]